MPIQRRQDLVRNSSVARIRHGMTLFEIVAVVMIIGMLGAMAATRFGTNAVADVGASGFARRIALDCLQARRRAISTGLNHLLRFTLVSGNATQYVLYSKASGGALTQVDDVHTVPTNVTVTTAGTTDMEFTFTGAAIAGYTITVASADRTKTVTVPLATGRALVQ
jgi:prepilin-type N-terminal cleavage/methylation domain-containing protein